MSNSDLYIDKKNLDTYFYLMGSIFFYFSQIKESNVVDTRKGLIFYLFINIVIGMLVFFDN